MLHNLPPGVANMIPQYMMTGAGGKNDEQFRIYNNEGGKGHLGSPA